MGTRRSVFCCVTILAVSELALETICFSHGRRTSYTASRVATRCAEKRDTLSGSMDNSPATKSRPSGRRIGGRSNNSKPTSQVNQYSVDAPPSPLPEIGEGFAISSIASLLPIALAGLLFLQLLGGAGDVQYYEYSSSYSTTIDANGELQRQSSSSMRTNIPGLSEQLQAPRLSGDPINLP